MDTTEDNGIFVNEAQLPHVILHGAMANLSALRQVETQSEFLLQRGEPLVATPIACRVGLQGGNVVAGEVYIASSQVLFVASDGNASKDLAIGATCITLHAMTEEPELALYLQLTEAAAGDNGGGDEEETTPEVTITPLDPDASQVLFDGLCKLVSLHPLLEDDEEDGGREDYFADGSDDLIWAPPASHYNDEDDDGEGGGGGGATQEEREAMLEQLDSLLQEGQFEDAEEEEK
jgi:hypothetical protein